MLILRILVLVAVVLAHVYSAPYPREDRMQGGQLDLLSLLRQEGVGGGRLRVPPRINVRDQGNDGEKVEIERQEEVGRVVHDGVVEENKPSDEKRIEPDLIVQGPNFAGEIILELPASEPLLLEPIQLVRQFVGEEKMPSGRIMPMLIVNQESSDEAVKEQKKNAKVKDPFGELDLKSMDDQIRKTFTDTVEGRQYASLLRVGTRVLYLLGPKMLARLLREFKHTVLENEQLAETVEYVREYLHSMAGRDDTKMRLLRKLIIKGWDAKATGEFGKTLLVFLHGLGAEDSGRMMSVVKLLIDENRGGEINSSNARAILVRLLAKFTTVEGRQEIFRTMGRLLTTLDAGLVAKWVLESQILDFADFVASDVLSIVQSFVPALSDEEVQRLIQVETIVERKLRESEQVDMLSRLVQLRKELFHQLDSTTRKRLIALLEKFNQDDATKTMAEEVMAAEAEMQLVNKRKGLEPIDA